MRRKQLSVIVRRVPFRPFELALDNGNRYRITHPEAIWPTKFFVGILESDGLAALVEYDAISEVQVAAQRNGRAKSTS